MQQTWPNLNCEGQYEIDTDFEALEGMTFRDFVSLIPNASGQIRQFIKNIKLHIKNHRTG